MAKIDELKETFYQNCQDASRDVSSGKQFVEISFAALRETGIKLIEEAYSTGQRETFDAIRNTGNTLGGRK